MLVLLVLLLARVIAKSQDYAMYEVKTPEPAVCGYLMMNEGAMTNMRTQEPPNKCILEKAQDLVTIYNFYNQNLTEPMTIEVALAMLRFHGGNLMNTALMMQMVHTAKQATLAGTTTSFRH